MFSTRNAVVFLALFGLIACKTAKKDDKPKPPPPPTSVLMRVIAAPDLNPNDKGEATPVDLRIYQLTERPTFTEASFEELWTKAKVVLKATVIGDPTVINFRPGEKDMAPAAHEIKLDPKTKFLGLMGLFSTERKEGLEERKLVVSVPEMGNSVVLLTKHKIVMQAPKKEEAPKRAAPAKKEPEKKTEAKKDPAKKDPAKKTEAKKTEAPKK